jgi:hypothetical protein
MLLAEYYEHGVEHAPPRDPSGCMQRRERYYEAPPSPYVVVPGLLTQSEADRKLGQWVDSRRTAFLSGQPFSAGESKLVEQLAGESSLKAETLLDLGRGFNFLESDLLAACWYRAGLAKAQGQYSDTAPGDPSVRPLLYLMDQTKALWRLRDYPTMEKRFALAMRLYPSLSPESRRAGYLHGVAIFYQAQYARAADAMLAVQADHDRVGDLGMLERSDLEEMEWELGLFLSAAGRDEESLPHLQAIIKLSNRDRKMYALNAYIRASNRLGRTERVEEYSAELRKYQAVRPGR